MITAEPGGRTIGLEGEWGSGKSTIVQLVVGGLGPNFRAFVFDTWAHEGDPLRRSFLESLIRDLISAGWVDPEAWELRIEELARRRRSTTQTTVQDLTRNGRWLAASLFVVPIGTAFLGRWLGQKHVDPRLAALAATLTLFPLLLAAILVMAARGRKANRAAGLATLEELHPLAILAKANKSTQQSDTIETPEPTSIEFAREFSALVKEALAPDERRLLIVLDNLDRVGAATAGQVLATLQTFIGGGAGDEAWEPQVWVMLPYDRRGLSELWPEDNLVEQFLGKIRQIRFETPPLVLSDWRGHLRRLLDGALPDTPTTELDDLVRLVAAVRVERSSLHGKDFAATATPPTPRELVQLVNEIGSVHRQRQELPLTHLAYFAILRREQLDVAIELLEGRVPSERVERLLGADVRENLAALHFNVEPTRAGQLLLGEPLSAGLVQGEPDVVQNLASYPGFWEVIEALPFEEWAADGGMDFALAASALDRSGVIEAIPVGTRRTLAGAISSATTWRLTSDQAGDGLGAILLAVSPEPAAASAMLKLVSEKDGKTAIEPPAVRGRILGLVALLDRLNVGGLGAAVQAARIAVPGEATQFLLACDLLAASDEAGTYWKVLQPSVGFPDVVTAIAGWAAQAPADGRSIAALRVVTSDSRRGKWDPAIEAFGTYLRDPALAFSPAVSFALDVVDVLETVKEGLTAQLADEGWLMNVCYIADAAGDAVAASVAAFLHLEQLPALPEPPAQANAASGAALLRECLANPAAHADLADALRRLIADKQSDVVFDVAAALPEAAPWAKLCIEDMAKEDRFKAATVVNRWTVLDDLADATVLDEMLLRLIRGGTLLAATREAAAGTAAALEVRVFSLLEKDPELAAQTEVRVLREVVIDRLRSLSAEAWYSELTAEGSSIELLRLLAPHEPQPKLAVPFQEALIRHGSAVAAGEATVQDAAEWSNLLAALDVDHYRSAVANGLASEVARLPGPIAANFYEAYGSALASEGQVLQHDQLISSVFSAAAGNDDAATLTWATELVRDHPELLDGLQPADKVANLRAVVEDALKGSEPSDELIECGATIGVSLPSEEPEEEET